MSLACFECNRIGSFNIIILYFETGLDLKNNVSDYKNFYTDCLNFEDIELVEISNFAVVRLTSSESSIFSPEKSLSKSDIKYISDNELQLKLPKIYSKLTEK